MILAQATPEPGSTMQFILIIGLFANIGMAMATIYMARHAGKQREILPDPLRVQKMEKLAAEKDCMARHADSTRGIEQLHQQLIELEKSRETARQQASEDRRAIYKHIDVVRLELSQKIDDMPSKIIADLRNAKGLLES